MAIKTYIQMEDLPPGFRFFPTEEELVSFYLHKKLEGQSNAIDRVIPVVDINGVEPWNLPPLAGELCREDKEQWFFFSPGQEREARGGRPNRTTACGYWKATGSPGYVYSSNNKVIGIKKTMVFYIGKAPTGRKTKWKLNEYRAIQNSINSNVATPQLRREFSLCRVYVVSGSFRAFDRRPLEKGRSGEIDQNKFAAAAAAAGMNESSSSHFTQLASGGLLHTSSAGGGSSNNDHGGNEFQLQEPLLEWDFQQQNFNWP